MIKPTHILAAALAVAVSVSQADAHRYHHHHHKAAATGKIHYGGKPGLGYWRNGPATGRGFAFSSYKGDPFGADDYFDGDRCNYLHHRDVCVANRIFSGFH